MSTQTYTSRATDVGRRQAPRALRSAQLALALGVASTVAFAGISVLTTRTSGDGAFKHTADYWFTGIGIPIALAGFVLVAAMYLLQQGRAGRLGMAGLVLNNIALVVLAAQLATSVAAGSEVQWGPTYPLATVATFVGLTLFAAASWRVGALPRWLLALWPVVWVVGSFAAIGASPLLLGALFATMAALLPRRIMATTGTNS